MDYDSDTDKVIVILTDGNNQVYDHGSQGPRGSDFTSFGRLHDFMGASATIQQGKVEWNTRQSRICGRIKDEGILIYAITFGGSVDAVARTLYEQCASRREFYFHSPDNATLRTIFRTIGVQLSNLRIAR